MRHVSEYDVLKAQYKKLQEANIKLLKEVEHWRDIAKKLISEKESKR